MHDTPSDERKGLRVPSRLSVALVGPSPSSLGGVASHLDDLARALIDRGHSVTRFVWPTEGGPAPSEGHSPVIAWRNPSTLLTFWRWLDSRAAVVHFHHYDAAAFLGPLATLHGVPTVVTLHGYYAREQTILGGGRIAGPRALGWIERRAVSEADAIIAVDHRIASWCRSEHGRIPDLVLPNPLDLRQMSPQSHQGRSDILLCPRLLTPKNGVEVAVGAMAQLTTQDEKLRLVIAGDGPLFNPLKRAALALGVSERVEFLGGIPRKGVLDLIRSSFAVLIPSIPVGGVEEATSIAALETMACGIPVIASSIGGLREIIQDGVTGFLVAPNAPQEIAKIVLRLRADRQLWSRVGRMARETVVREHDWAVQIDLVEAIYERAVQKR